VAAAVTLRAGAPWRCTRLETANAMRGVRRFSALTGATFVVSRAAVVMPLSRLSTRVGRRLRVSGKCSFESKRHADQVAETEHRATADHSAMLVVAAHGEPQGERGWGGEFGSLVRNDGRATAEAESMSCRMAAGEYVRALCGPVASHSRIQSRGQGVGARLGVEHSALGLSALD